MPRKAPPKRKQYRVVFEIGPLYGVCFVYADSETEAQATFLAEYASRTVVITQIKEEA